MSVIMYSSLSPGALTDPFRDTISNNKDLVVAAVLQKRADGSHCVLETTGRSDLVPDFTKASQKESNILSLFSDIPLCHSDEEELIKQHAESAFLRDEGVQVAVVDPLTFGAALGVVGCALGVTMAFVEKERGEIEYSLLRIGQRTWDVSALATVGVMISTAAKTRTGTFFSNPYVAAGGFAIMISTLSCNKGATYFLGE